MNRSFVIQEVSECLGLPEEQVRDVVHTFLETIANHLSQGDSVNLWGFGKFVPRLRKGHVRLNPLRGEFMNVPERLNIAFVPSGGLRKRVNA